METLGLLRIAANASLSTAQWLVRTSVQTGTRVAQGLAAGESPTKIVHDLGTELRSAAQSALGVSPPAPQPGASASELRERGAELLRQSSDVHFVEDTHPAYERILGELTPDEARIIKFLYREGPQPTVDVRTNRPLGIGSELIEAGLSMIGRQAGVRNLTRTNAYLNNLFRLGLVWFSREVLWKFIDQRIIDGATVNGVARGARALGWANRWLQTGQVGVYVAVFVVGVLLLLWRAMT